MVGAGLFVVTFGPLVVDFGLFVVVIIYGLLSVADGRFVVVTFGPLMVALGPSVVRLWSGFVSTTWNAVS